MPHHRIAFPRASYGTSLAAAHESTLTDTESVKGEFTDLMYTEDFGVLRTAHEQPSDAQVFSPAASDESLSLLVSAAQGHADLVVGEKEYRITAGETLFLPRWTEIQTKLSAGSALYAAYAPRSRLQALCPTPLPHDETPRLSGSNALLNEAFFSVLNVLLNARLSPDDERAGALRISIEGVIAALAQALCLDSSPSTLERAYAIAAQRFRSPHFSAQRLAEEMHMSRAQLYRIFQAELRTPKEHIQYLRRRAAEKSLRRYTDPTDADLRRVAAACGYRNMAALVHAMGNTLPARASAELPSSPAGGTERAAHQPTALHGSASHP